jgi:hypothetical protein
MLLLLLMLLLRRHLSQLVGREVARLLARSGLGEAAEQIRLQQVGQRVVWVGGCVYARFEAQTSLGICVMRKAVGGCCCSMSSTRRMYSPMCCCSALPYNTDMRRPRLRSRPLAAAALRL